MLACLHRISLSTTHTMLLVLPKLYPSTKAFTRKFHILYTSLSLCFSLNNTAVPFPYHVQKSATSNYLFMLIFTKKSRNKSAVLFGQLDYLVQYANFLKLFLTSNFSSQFNTSDTTLLYQKCFLSMIYDLSRHASIGSQKQLYESRDWDIVEKLDI